MNRWIGILASGLLLQAQPKPARPLFTTSSGLADPLAVEVELGGQGRFQRDSTRHFSSPLQLNLGIATWADLRLAWTGPTTLRNAAGEDHHGFGDPLVGGQLLLLRQARAGWDLGLAYWHKIPRASQAGGIGSGAHDDSALVVLTRADGPWCFDLNAGANWIGRPQGSQVRQPALSVALTRAFGAGWNLSLDAYALGATELGPRTSGSMLALTRDLGPRLTVDVAVEAGFTAQAPRMAIHAGLVWKPGRP